MSRRLRTGALIFALILLGGSLTVSAVLNDRSLPRASTTVLVPRGETATEVARRLRSAGVIGSAAAFSLLARLTGKAPDVKAGEFRFAPHQTVGAVLTQVTTRGSQIAQWVSLPEGYTAREMAQAIADRGISTQSALENAFAARTLDIEGTRTASLEGFLFPSTYLIPEDASPSDIAAILTGQFLKELPSDAARRAKALGLTVPQVVTLASLIEREAKADDERPLMAGVYYNRLRRGMPLEVDATIEYIFPEHKTVITRADLAIDSPYNSYRHTGLPPTPIANPGKPSLDAAFHPKASDYLFYVYKGDGHHAFARTYSEHEANVARYLH
jgi:UPF0755 protein